MTLRCRYAALDDVPVLAELNHQLIRDEGHRNPMTLPELNARMRSWLVSGEYRAALFEEGNEVVGYGLYRETEAEVHLRQFFVVRHRRRQGIGRRAMEHLVVTLWPAGKRLTVSVLAGNPVGISFWRAMGYKDYDLTLEMLPRTNGQDPSPSA